jgi:hypothetical protein
MARVVNRGPSFPFPFFQPGEQLWLSPRIPTAFRELNDKLRQDLTTSLGQQAVERLVKTIQVFDDFHHANDPHQEAAMPGVITA